MTNVAIPFTLKSAYIGLNTVNYKIKIYQVLLYFMTSLPYKISTD